MNIRKVTGLLITTALLTGMVAGCGSSEATPSPQATMTNTEVKKEAKPVEISFSHWRTEDKESYAKLYQKLKQKLPNITVNEEIIPSADYNKVLQTRLASGAASDIFGINGVLTNGAKFNAAGNLEPLNNVANLKNIKPDFLKLTKDDKGNQFAAIWSDVNYAMMYNKDLFDKAGVKVPTSWAEFSAACKKLKDGGIEPIAVGGKDAYVLNWILSMIQVNDYMVKEPDAYTKLNTRKAKYTELTGLRSSLDKFQELVKLGVFKMDQLGMSYDDAVALFSQGKAAMLPAGSFTAPTVLKANPNIKMGAFNIAGEKSENNNWVYIGMSYAINKGANDEKKEGAKAFLNFMLEKDISKQFAEETAMFTTLSDVEMKFKDSIVEDYAKLSLSKPYIFPAMDATVVDATWSSQQGSDLQAMIAGKATIDSLLKDLDGKIIKN